jgi:hypothetical protein
VLLKTRVPAVNQTVNVNTFQPINGARAAIVVEEERVILDLSFDAVFDHDQANGEIHLTYFINGEDHALPYTNGLFSAGRTSASTPHDMNVRHRMELTPGEYVIEVKWKTPSGVGRLRTAEWPGELLAELRSHPNTLAQGTNSKTQGVY